MYVNLPLNIYATALQVLYLLLPMIQSVYEYHGILQTCPDLTSLPFLAVMH